MSIHVLAMLVLLAMFLVASFLPINLGILALCAAFVLGTGFGGLDVDGVMAGFPGDLFVLIVGVTYLFAVAQENGTLQRIIDLSLRVVGNRIALIPWLMFALAALVAAAGALSAASVAIVAPIALRLGAQLKLNQLLMGLMVVQGATAGSFSPLSPFGAITNDLLASNDLPREPGGLFLNSLLFNIVLAAVVFCVFGGLRLLRKQTESVAALAAAAPGAAGGGGTSSSGSAGSVEPDEPPRSEDSGGGVAQHGNQPVIHQILTAVAILCLVLSTMIFGLDVGFMALIAALALSLLSPSRYSDCIKNVPWSAVLLVCGVITYVGVLDELGTIDWLGDLLTGGGNPLLTGLAAAYIGGIISAFASTAGVLGASIPLAIPVLETGALPLLGTVSAIGIASSVVDVSPLSTNGALLVANQRTMDPKLFFRKLLVWSVAVIALAPLLAWLIFIVL